jgi:farnesyl diphosphate synthase
LVNKALEITTPEQRKILEENYGQKDDTKEAVIKKLYDDLKLKEIYHEFEEKRASEIRDMINNVDESEGLKKEVFEVFLSKIYKRTK